MTCKRCILKAQETKKKEKRKTHFSLLSKSVGRAVSLFYTILLSQPRLLRHGLHISLSVYTPHILLGGFKTHPMEIGLARARSVQKHI